MLDDGDEDFDDDIINDVVDGKTGSFEGDDLAVVDLKPPKLLVHKLRKVLLGG